MNYFATSLILLLLLTGTVSHAHPGIAESLKQLDVLIATNPHTQALFIRRASLHTSNGEWALAQHDLNHAQSLGGQWKIAFELGRLHYHKGEFQTALDYLTQYLTRYSSHASSHLLRAKAAQQIERFDTALDSYHEYFRFSKSPHPAEYLAAARILASPQRAELKSALNLLDDGLGRLGLVPQLQRYATELELEQNATENALKRWRTLEGAFHSSPAWKTTLAQILFAAGRSNKALTLIKTIRTELEAMKVTPARRDLGEKLRRLDLEFNGVS